LLYNALSAKFITGNDDLETGVLPGSKIEVISERSAHQLILKPMADGPHHNC
jgi:hypothetical protein